MLLLYFFIAIWVSVNGISSPFDDALSFFMWAAVLVPVIACIYLLLLSDDDRKYCTTTFKLKGGVTMTDEGILFCFSMLFSLCIS